MAELNNATVDADTIRELREELDRLRNLIFAVRGIGGGLLDSDLMTGPVTKLPNDNPSD